MTIPLIILAVLSITAGFIEWPHNIMHVTLFSDLVEKVLPATVIKQNVPEEIIFQGIAAWLHCLEYTPDMLCITAYHICYRTMEAIPYYNGAPQLFSIKAGDLISCMMLYL